MGGVFSGEIPLPGCDFPRPIDPTDERQAFFHFSERVAAAGRVCKAFGPRVLAVLWNLVIGSCFLADWTSLAAGNRRGHWSTPSSQVELVLTSIEE